MIRRFQAFALLAAVTAAGLSAEGLSFGFEGPRFNFSLGFPLPAGADVEFRQPIAVTPFGPLSAVLRIGAGYEDKRLLRDALTGDPIAAESDANKDTVYANHANSYNAPNGQWALGLLACLVPGEKTNLAEAFLAWRGRYDLYLNDLSTSVFPDAQGLFGNAVFAGLAWNGVTTDDRRVMSGISAEASAEWSPAGISSVAVDYLRLDAQAQGYLPLFSHGNEGLNLFSAYLAGFGSVDWATGDSIPIHVMQSFGGRDVRSGLGGGSVRGYPSKAWDASLKAVANLELRLLGPALFGLPWFMPMAYGFFDAGGYAGMAGATTASYAEASGLIMSAGGGFALNVLDFAYIGFKAGVLVPGEDTLFAVYVPELEKGFFSIEFMLHF